MLKILLIGRYEPFVPIGGEPEPRVRVLIKDWKLTELLRGKFE
jgi:hypothetical protein